VEPDTLQTSITIRSLSAQLAPIALHQEPLVKAQALALWEHTSLSLASSAVCHAQLALNVKKLEQQLHEAAQKVIIVQHQPQPRS
jgi:hypothetical protein